MVPLISQHGPQIAELCQRFHVQRLELFCSATSSQFDPQRSDVNFLVEFAPLAEGQHADAYFVVCANRSPRLSAGPLTSL